MVSCGFFGIVSLACLLKLCLVIPLPFLWNLSQAYLEHWNIDQKYFLLLLRRSGRSPSEKENSVLWWTCFCDPDRSSKQMLHGEYPELSGSWQFSWRQQGAMSTWPLFDEFLGAGITSSFLCEFAGTLFLSRRV